MGGQVKERLAAKGGNSKADSGFLNSRTDPYGVFTSSFIHSEKALNVWGGGPSFCPFAQPIKQEAKCPS